MSKRFSHLLLTVLALTVLVAPPAFAQRGGGMNPLLGLHVDPSGPIDFRAVPIDGGETLRSFRITNYGPKTVILEIPDVVENFKFTQGAGTHSLAAGTFLDCWVQYEPYLVGVDFFEFYPCATSDLVIALRGEGTKDPDCGQDLLELDFGQVLDGTTKQIPVLVSNKSGVTQPIRFFGSCSAFTASPGQIYVDNGQVGQFDVEFSPQATGEFVGEYNTGCGTTIWLRGTGITSGATSGTEAASSGAEGVPRSSSFGMSASPNPMRGSSQIQFAYVGSKDLSAELRIVDLRGRVLRTQAMQIAPGAHTWTWDCRDGQGGSVAAGVYFIQLVAPGSTVSKKVTVLH